MTTHASSVEAAFATFTGMRRERVEKIVAEGNKWSNTKVAGPVARVIRDAMLPFAFKLMAKQAHKNGWVFDHHIEWDRPTTAA